MKRTHKIASGACCWSETDAESQKEDIHWPIIELTLCQSVCPCAMDGVL